MAVVEQSLWAENALLSDGWASAVQVNIDALGNIQSVKTNQKPLNSTVLQGTLIPGITNLHSHAHQRAMAGLAEKTSSGSAAQDSFWSWRSIMYHYLEKIEPDDLHTIASQLYVEMLKFGYTGVAEFQYLHHDTKGNPYQDRSQMTRECLHAAQKTGIAFTALPVLYQYGGFGSQLATPGQKRFLNDAQGFLSLVESLSKDIDQSDNMSLGIAPHSLRAVDEALLNEVLAACNHASVIHIHIAEQLKEVEDCLAWSKQRPVEWLMDHFDVNPNWCLIHATHLTQTETKKLADSKAIAGLCPTTEANLGDGFFNAHSFLEQQGRFGIGSDSHISISPVEEIRWLEYGQRLVTHNRNVLNSQEDRHTGHYLYQKAVEGGAGACARLSGKIEPGYRADFVVLDHNHPRMYGRHQSDLIDSWIFSGNGNPVEDVYVGGVKVIHQGHHFDEENISSQFRSTLDRLAG